jgi:hypothetical protein
MLLTVALHNVTNGKHRCRRGRWNHFHAPLFVWYGYHQGNIRGRPAREDDPQRLRPGKNVLVPEYSQAAIGATGAAGAICDATACAAAGGAVALLCAAVLVHFSRWFSTQSYRPNGREETDSARPPPAARPARRARRRRRATAPRRTCRTSPWAPRAAPGSTAGSARPTPGGRARDTSDCHCRKTATP